MKDLLLRLMLASALGASFGGLAGCYDDSPGPQYAAGADAAPGDDSADLVEVSPGVEVIADYDEPIFFADDFYWVNRGGYWYRSGWYGGGWERSEPSARISGIVHPEGYRHYHPAGYVGHAHIRGGYEAHARYHAEHGGGGVHVRAAVHAGGHRR